MMKNFTFLIILFSFYCQSQSRVLVYHETNGFRHGSINSGISLIEDLGNQNGWDTDNTQNSNVFAANDFVVNGVYKYDVIVFCNTSGDNLLNGNEKTVFEEFIKNGGGFIGIHAATDTYRDRSWPFYNELVGGIVQTDPNHTPNNFNADMEVKSNHPIVEHIGNTGATWNKNEEYYYWRNNGGQLSNDNTVLLEVERTGEDDYDEARPITWYKEAITVNGETFNGIKSFYTALGHNNGDYNSNDNFKTMIKNAIMWAGDNTLSINDIFVSEFKIAPNPVKDFTNIYINKLSKEASLKVYDVLGKVIFSKTIYHSDLNKSSYKLDLSKYNKGVYLLSITADNKQKSFKLIKS